MIAGLALLALIACPARVRLETHPAGALVTLPSGKVVTTPTTAHVVWYPFRRVRLTVAAPGYRTLTAHLGRHEFSTWQMLGDGVYHPFAIFRSVPRREVDFVLVPDHGPAGTWTPEDQGLSE